MNLGQDYLFSQASSMLPFYNFNQVSSQIGQQLFPSFVKQIGQNFIDIGDQQQQQQSKHYLHPHHHFHHQQHHDPSMEYQGQNQYHQAGYHPSRPKYYRPPVNNLQYPQQYGPNEDDSIQQSQPVPSGVSDNENEQKTAQSDESVSKPSYYYPTLSSQQSQVQYQYSPEMIGTSPYTFHENPSQMNTFKSRPYGSNPGTLDVHKVLDQFIRSAGLSPKGDHDNVYNGNSDEKALSVKKLYTYPFYFSSSGDRPTSIRRHSNDEYDADKQQFYPEIALGNSIPSSSNSLKSNQNSWQKSSKIKMDYITKPMKVAPENGNEDETIFIARNAAALQDFLNAKKSSKSIVNDEKRSDDSTRSDINA
ncbi:runt-like protein [Sarcoptes scabiei]|nr:runt-like protein [Sarcoptes scabiei]